MCIRDRYKIDSLNSDFTYDEPFMWSISAGILLEYIDKIFPERKILHAHEWLSGGTILYIKKKNLNYKTILTIHGTVMGRYLSSKGIRVSKEINFDTESYKYNINAKHQLEKNTVLHTDIFTTVSDILDEEAKMIFGRKSDKILYNYLDIENFEIREKRYLKEFVIWYFYPYYEIDLERTIFIYTIGRYEFINKGYDLFIDLLKYLNESDIDFNIIAFIFVPFHNKGINPNVRYLYNLYLSLKEKLNSLDTLRDIYRKKLDIELEKIEGYPPISTHITENDITNKIIQSNLLNRKEDKVKVVYVPTYIGNDEIFNDKELLKEFDIGVFLSRYEPYGYTPLEALNNGIPIILSNKTGFYLSLKKKNIKSNSILVVDLDNFNNELKRILSFIKDYFYLNKTDKIKIRCEAFNISLLYSWEKNINEYFELYKY